MATTTAAAGFRAVLGHYPTGVCAVTSTHEDNPVGVIVGSFTSVSLLSPGLGRPAIIPTADKEQESRN